MPDSDSPFPRLRASVLPLRPPAFFTSAARAPLSSTGSMPATTSGTMVLAAGRHRRRAQHRGQRPVHLRRAALAGPRLGRRVQAIRAPCPAPPAGRGHLRQGPCLSRLHPRPRGRRRTVSSAQGAWLFNPGMRELSREESDRRAAAGETVRAALSRSPRREPHSALCRRRLRRAVQARRRGRRLRPAAFRRHADLPPRLLRRRRRSPHQPHHPRPGSPDQHLQAPADL